MPKKPDGEHAKKAIAIYCLRRDRFECVKRIHWLIDVFEASVEMDDWYRAMICTYRIKTALYCYQQLCKKIREQRS